MNDLSKRSAEERERRIQRELLGYLLENPDAADTLEGIAAWWLARQEVRVGVELVARVLERLEAEGLVERVGNPDRPLFRLRTPPRPSNPDDPARQNG